MYYNGFKTRLYNPNIRCLDPPGTGERCFERALGAAYPARRDCTVRVEGQFKHPGPGLPNVPLLVTLWSQLDVVWGVLKGSWGVLG